MKGSRVCPQLCSLQTHNSLKHPDRHNSPPGALTEPRVPTVSFPIYVCRGVCVCVQKHTYRESPGLSYNSDTQSPGV